LAISSGATITEPADKSLLPEAALDSWRQWDANLNSRPVILGPLDGGLSNRSYLVDSPGQKMVLRINGSSSALPGASRSDEVRIWQAASRQGIAPRIIFADEEIGLLVSEYIDSAVPSKPPFKAALVSQALELLTQCHQLDLATPAINYAGHIEHYWRIIESRGNLHNPLLEQQRKPMQRVLEDLHNHGGETGLCHHDPVVANFVGDDDRLLLIDWEYASRGLLVMDFAAFAVEWNIDDATILAQTDVGAKPLDMAKSLYGYLCQLWLELAP
jgi:thiamine kinase-like enzyme